MRIAFTFLGCRLNEAEVERWARQFQLEGFQVVEDVGEADLVVVNSCAVTGEAVRKSRKLIRRLHRLNPSAKLVVSGCYATLRSEEVAERLGVDLVVPNGEKEGLVRQATRLLAKGAPRQIGTPPKRLRCRAFIKVQDGCRHRCTFCIVTVARGEERSRPIGEIVGEIRQLEREGVREIVLTGVHLGGYGRDLGTSLASLLERVLEETEIPRIRLGSLEPWELEDTFFDLFQNPRMMPHLHLPLQSGSDPILKRMARRHRLADFERLVERLKGVRGDLHFTTDIIVGFPGETEDDFRRTCEAVVRIGFSRLHLFPYSPREGTPAARFPEQVPPEIKAERMAILQEIDQKLRAEALRAAVGQEVEVLWERLEEGKLRGYTPHYLPALMEGSGRSVGQIERVGITSVQNGVLAARPR